MNKIFLVALFATTLTCFSAEQRRKIDDDLRAAVINHIRHNVENIQGLIDKGANVNCKIGNDSLLKYCLVKGSMDHFEILLKNGAELNELDEHGNNLLMQYVQELPNENNIWLDFTWSNRIEFLIPKFDINACNKDGNNFGHLLMLRQKKLDRPVYSPNTIEQKIFKQVIFAGLDINKANNDGKNLYQMAIDCGLKEFIKLIQDYNAFLEHNYNGGEIDFAQAGKDYEEQFNRQVRVEQYQRQQQKRCCIIM